MQQLAFILVRFQHMPGAIGRVQHQGVVGFGTDQVAAQGRHHGGAFGGDQLQRSNQCLHTADGGTGHGVGHIEGLLDQAPGCIRQAFIKLLFVGVLQQLPRHLPAEQLAALAGVVGVAIQVGAEQALVEALHIHLPHQLHHSVSIQRGRQWCGRARRCADILGAQLRQVAQGEVGKALGVAAKLDARCDQHVFRVYRLLGKARREQGFQSACDLVTQGRDAVQIVAFLRRAQAVLFEQFHMQALVCLRGHAKPDRQGLLIDQAAGDVDGAAQVGRRCAVDQRVHAILEALCTQPHREQVVDLVQHKTAVRPLAVVEQMIVDTLQRSEGKTLMGRALGRGQVLDQQQAVMRILQSSVQAVAQGLDRGKALIAASRRPQHRRTGMLGVDAAALGHYKTVGQGLGVCADVQAQPVGVRDKAVQAMPRQPGHALVVEHTAEQGQMCRGQGRGQAPELRFAAQPLEQTLGQTWPIVFDQQVGECAQVMVDKTAQHLVDDRIKAGDCQIGQFQRDEHFRLAIKPAHRRRGQGDGLAGQACDKVLDHALRGFRHASLAFLRRRFVGIQIDVIGFQVRVPLGQFCVQRMGGQIA